MPTALEDILDPSLAIIGNKLAIAALLQRRIANTNCEFHVKTYGAVSDGTTDDTAAVLAACAAAEVNGGVVIFPSGVTRIRQGYRFAGPTDGFGSGSVSVRGTGLSTSVLLWDPSPTYYAADCFIWHTTGTNYYGGGISDIQIQAAQPLSSGTLIAVDGVVRFECANVWLTGFQPTNGFHVREAEGPSQHIHWRNCEFQGQAVGLIIDSALACYAFDLRLNQNLTTPGILRGGMLSWYCGLLQDSNKSLEIRPAIENGFYLRMYDVHVEINGSAPAIKAYEATAGGGFGGQLHISSGFIAGDTTFLDANHYEVHLAAMRGGGDGILVFKGRNCPNTKLADLGNFPDRFDLDAYTTRNTTWYNGGNISIGTISYSADFDGQALTLGAPLTPCRVTQTERDALPDVSESDEVHNLTLKVPQWYTGTRWRSYSEPSVTDILGVNLLAEWDARYGIGSNTWTDTKGGRVLTGSGSPTYASDTTKFRGRSVWKFLAGSSQLMDTGGSGATLVASGAGAYYFSIVMRLTVLTDNTMRILNAFDNAESDIMVNLTRKGVDGGINAYQIGGYTYATEPVVDANPHLFEVFLDGSGHRVFAIDGVEYADTTPGAVTTTIIQRLSIMAFHGSGGVGFASGSVARVRACTSVPSTIIRTALLELDRDIWGF